MTHTQRAQVVTYGHESLCVYSRPLDTGCREYNVQVRQLSILRKIPMPCDAQIEPATNEEAVQSVERRRERVVQTRKRAIEVDVKHLQRAKRHGAQRHAYVHDAAWRDALVARDALAKPTVSVWREAAVAPRKWQTFQPGDAGAQEGDARVVHARLGKERVGRGVVQRRKHRRGHSMVAMRRGGKRQRTTQTHRLDDEDEHIRGDVIEQHRTRIKSGTFFPIIIQQQCGLLGRMRKYCIGQEYLVC